MRVTSVTSVWHSGERGRWASRGGMRSSLIPGVVLGRRLFAQWVRSVPAGALLRGLQAGSGTTRVRQRAHSWHPVGAPQTATE